MKVISAVARAGDFEVVSIGDVPNDIRCNDWVPFVGGRVGVYLTEDDNVYIHDRTGQEGYEICFPQALASSQVVVDGVEVRYQGAAVMVLRKVPDVSGAPREPAGARIMRALTRTPRTDPPVMVSLSHLLTRSARDIQQR